MRNRTSAAAFGPTRRGIAWLALLAFVLNPILVAAQTTAGTAGTLKAGDIIRITVPGRPDLDQDLTIDAVGTVEIEPVGSIQLGGLTAPEARVLLKQKLRLFYPTLDALDLEVGRTGTIRIYVLGAASTTGVVTFESAPTLWDLVRAIGGADETANLSDSRIIRDVDGKPQVHPVDLSAVMAGQGEGSYQMHDGDTLIIPALLEGIPGVNAAVGVKVFGSVAVPTIVPIAQGTPLMDVLMLAGAPTEQADKTKIHWVHNNGVRNESTVVDLTQYLLFGDNEGNPTVYPGDTINVELNQPSWVRTNVPFILGSLAAIATIYLAYDNVVNN